MQCIYFIFFQDQQEQAEKQKDKRKDIEKEWKKKEQSQVQQGKKPFFLKKSKTII